MKVSKLEKDRSILAVSKTKIPEPMHNVSKSTLPKIASRHLSTDRGTANRYKEPLNEEEDYENDAYHQMT